MDVVSPAYQTALAIPQQISAYDHWNTLTGQSHQPSSARKSWIHKHRIYAAQGSDALDRPCHPNGGEPHTQTGWKRAHANKDDGNWDTKTLWKATSNGAVFIHVSLKRLFPTDQDGSLSPPRQPLPLTRIGDSVSLQQGIDVTGQRPPKYKTFQCDICGRLCASSFGLRSHMHCHRWVHRLRHHRFPMDYQE